MASLITDDREFFRLWDDASLKIADLARHYGVHVTTIYAKAKRLRLGDKPLDDPEMLPDDPTPEEIEERCAAVRSSWPEWRLRGIASNSHEHKDGYMPSVDIRRFATDHKHGGFVCR